MIRDDPACSGAATIVLVVQGRSLKLYSGIVAFVEQRGRKSYRERFWCMLENIILSAIEVTARSRPRGQKKDIGYTQRILATRPDVRSDLSANHLCSPGDSTLAPEPSYEDSPGQSLSCPLRGGWRGLLHNQL